MNILIAEDDLSLSSALSHILRETGSFGLGLAIAREIAREHKGNIEATSNREDGTVFTATLPLGR